MIPKVKETKPKTAKWNYLKIQGSYTEMCIYLQVTEIKENKLKLCLQATENKTEVQEIFNNIYIEIPSVIVILHCCHNIY
jgi:hypothetical protein